MTTKYINAIKFQATLLGPDVEQVLKNLLTDYPDFTEWSGSHHPSLHHYGQGGLVRHTAEVISLGFKCRETLMLENEIDAAEFFFAALFHDTGKIYDYEKVGNEWKSSEHKRMIHHVSRSGLIWSRTLHQTPLLLGKYHDIVWHGILAHHGSRTAGSPVFPKTRVAWLLHLCDGISARMNDADKFDYLKVDTIRAL